MSISIFRRAGALIGAAIASAGLATSAAAAARTSPPSPAAMTSTTTLGAADTAPSVQPNPHGVISAINGFSLFKSPQAVWGAQIGAIQQQGVQVVRSDAAWADIQPQAPTANAPGYQWSSYDAWVAALASHYLTWQPIIDYNTGWTTAVADNAAYAAFAQAVAARYGAGGSFWAQNPRLPYEPARVFEIWNEEGGTGPNSISPAQYGPLYTAARNAIHAVDPSASVDVGSLGVGGTFNASLDYPGWYLVALFHYDPSLTTNVDGFGLHPYGTTALDTEKWLANFRYVLDQYHVSDTIPIDVTEFGWEYSSASETWRAQQMQTLGSVLARSNCGVREVAPYTWMNSSSAGDSYDWGFVAPNGTSTQLRPAALAWFGALTQGATQPTYTLCS
jgi:hypothetical protein